MDDYVIPRSKMDVLRRTKSDRVQPLSSTIDVSLNMFTHWQWPINNEMELQVCRPQIHGRENPALIKWKLSNKLTYSEAFSQQQARDDEIQRTADQRGIDRNVLRFANTGALRDGTPLWYMQARFQEIIVLMEDRLYVMYPRYLVMRDVQFMLRIGEKIEVAAVGQNGDTLEHKIERARVNKGKQMGSQ